MGRAALIIVALVLLASQFLQTFARQGSQRNQTILLLAEDLGHDHRKFLHKLLSQPPTLSVTIKTQFLKQLKPTATACVCRMLYVVNPVLKMRTWHFTMPLHRTHAHPRKLFVHDASDISLYNRQAKINLSHTKINLSRST